MSAIKYRVIIGTSSLAILILSLVLEGDLIPMLLMLLFALVALIVLYRDLPNLSNVSEDNPKAKTLRNVTVFSICVLVILIPTCALLDKTLESPLDCKEIQPFHPKGDQS